jgi:AcrR family transcriptional regulator
MLPDSPFRSPAQRAADRAAKRDAVLRAAVRMFNERGFHATSLDDVATSLGISKRTIYHYLASKDQVLLECVTIGLNQLLDAAAEARTEEGSGRARLARFLRRYAEINMDDFGRCVIRTGEEALSAESRPRFRALKRQIDSALRQLLSDAIADGTIAATDVRMTAFALAGALNWPARWHDPSGPMPPDAVAATLVDVLLRGLDPRLVPGPAHSPSERS